MKIQKFNEEKDPLLGEESINVEVKVIFKVGKSRKYDGYSLRVSIPGLNFGGNFSDILLGQGLSEEQLIIGKNKFLSEISIIHKTSNKYNL